MRASFIRSYGTPSEVVEIGDLPDPLVGPDSVLIDVAAAGVNPVDSKILGGYLDSAYPHAMPLIPGWDVAGTVRSVGPAVTSFEVGDRVAAYARKDHIQFGTFAQQVAVREDIVAAVPEEVSLVTAAAVPLAGLTALQLLDAADVRPGDTVLVHAASGGVGSFVSQLAVRRGALVVGTASPPNHDRLRSWGVTPVDYHGDLLAGIRAAAPDGVTVVLDLVGGDALSVTPQVLDAGGRVAGVLDPEALAKLRVAGYRARYVFVRPDAAGLTELLQRVAADELDVDIGARYPLEQAAEALEANRSGHITGKVVITMTDGTT